MNEETLPTTLLEAVDYFKNEDIAHDFVVNLRWPDGVKCSACGSSELYYISTRKVWMCKDKTCPEHGKRFSVKKGTIFEDSPIKLGKWLPAIWMIANNKNGKSSYELSRDLGVTQKTGWFMLHRIRLAMQTGTFEKLSGAVEVDETFVGGLAKNMHEGQARREDNGAWCCGKGRSDGFTRAQGRRARRGHSEHD